MQEIPHLQSVAGIESSDQWALLVTSVQCSHMSCYWINDINNSHLLSTLLPGRIIYIVVVILSITNSWQCRAGWRWGINEDIYRIQALGSNFYTSIYLGRFNFIITHSFIPINFFQNYFTFMKTFNYMAQCLQIDTLQNIKSSTLTAKHNLLLFKNFPCFIKNKLLTILSFDRSLQNFHQGCFIFMKIFSTLMGIKWQVWEIITFGKCSYFCASQLQSREWF